MTPDLRALLTELRDWLDGKATLMVTGLSARIDAALAPGVCICWHAEDDHREACTKCGCGAFTVAALAEPAACAHGCNRDAVRGGLCALCANGDCDHPDLPGPVETFTRLHAIAADGQREYAALLAARDRLAVELAEAATEIASWRDIAERLEADNLVGRREATQANAERDAARAQLAAEVEAHRLTCQALLTACKGQPAPVPTPETPPAKACGPCEDGECGVHPSGRPVGVGDGR